MRSRGVLASIQQNILDYRDQLDSGLCAFHADQALKVGRKFRLQIPFMVSIILATANSSLFGIQSDTGLPQ